MSTEIGKLGWTFSWPALPTLPSKQLRRDLRDLGVDIAFDDFGTGFASLSSLQRFPLTTLKIDRSFISDIARKPQDAAIVRAIVSMGNDLGLHTIAEGVETAEQEASLKKIGCRAVQGFRYGKPAPAVAIADTARRLGIAFAQTAFSDHRTTG